MSFSNLFYRFRQGDTSKIIDIDLMQSTSVALTGLAYSDVGICSYSRPDQGNAGATVITLSAGTRGTWSDGGFKEKDSTNAKGIYELGLPDAALAPGAPWVLVSLQNSGNTTILWRGLIWLADPDEEVKALIAGQTDSGVLSPDVFFDPLNVNVIKINGKACSRLTGKVSNSPTPTVNGFKAILDNTSTLFDGGGENVLVDYYLRFTDGANRGLGGRITGNADGSGGTDVAITFNPPLKVLPAYPDPFEICALPTISRAPGERTGSISAVDTDAFTCNFVPDMPEAAFGQEASNQFAGCRLRLEVPGSVSSGGTPGVEIPILESSWGVGYAATLVLPNTDFVAAILANILDARASIVEGPDAWQYQPPLWPILRLKVDNADSSASETSFKIKAGEDPVPTSEAMIRNGRLTFVSPGDNLKVCGKLVSSYEDSTKTVTLNAALPAIPSDGDDILIIP